MSRTDKECCRRRGGCCKEKDTENRVSVTEIPGRVIETKKNVETEVKKHIRGKAMKTLSGKCVFKVQHLDIHKSVSEAFGMLLFSEPETE